jgi:hypothetical protein
MIRKKNNAYKHIKANIAKLATIQQATEFSPSRLIEAFLKNLSIDEFFIKKKTKDEHWDWKLADQTAYKYFKKELAAYLKKNSTSSSFHTMQDYLKSNYLTKDYFGMDYGGAVENYFEQATILKDFVREAYISMHPITSDMNPIERAIRNQRLGKISVNHWIGDITNYDYFSQAPGFMMKNVELSLQYVELYIFNLLNEKQLDHDLDKLSSNQRLEAKLTPKTIQVKSKPLKIQKI